MRDLHRLWPIFDPSLPRGTLRSRKKPPDSFYRPKEPIQNPRDPEENAGTGNPEGSSSQTDGLASESRTTDEDTTLPLPEVPDVPDEWIREIIASGLGKRGKYGGSRCKHCKTCRNPHLKQSCHGLLAVRQWWDELGGVSPALVKKLALEIKEMASQGKKFGNRYRLRCGRCYTCMVKRGSDSGCRTVIAILTGTLPERLKKVAEGILPSVNPENASNWQDAAGTYDVDADNPNRESFWCYKREGEDLPDVRLLKQLHPDAKPSTLSSSSDDDTESEDLLRWMNWVPYLVSKDATQDSDSSSPNKRRKRKVRDEDMGGSDREFSAESLETVSIDEDDDKDENEEDTDSDFSNARTRRQKKRRLQRRRALGQRRPNLRNNNTSEISDDSADEQERRAIAPQSRRRSKNSTANDATTTRTSIRPTFEKRNRGPRRREIPAQPSRFTGHFKTWVCHNSLNDFAKPCGYVNVVKSIKCTLCGAPRWDGPKGELWARVSSIISQKGFRWQIPEDKGRPWSLEDVSGRIASRIAWESGPGGLKLAGCGSSLRPSPEDGSDPLKDIDSPAAIELSVLTRQIAEILPEIIESYQRLYGSDNALSTGNFVPFLRSLPIELRPKDASTGPEDSVDTARHRPFPHRLDSQNGRKKKLRKVKSRLSDARRTSLGRSVMALERAVRQLVEEQEGIHRRHEMIFGHLSTSTEARDDQQHRQSSDSAVPLGMMDALYRMEHPPQTSGSVPATAVVSRAGEEFSMDRREYARIARALNASDRPHTSDGYAEDPSERIGFGSFRASVRALFEETGAISEDLLEMLYSSRPESSWDRTSVHALLLVVKNVEMTQKLRDSMRTGGCIRFREALQEEMEKQLQRLAAAGHGMSQGIEGEKDSGLLSQPFLPETQQSQAILSQGHAFQTRCGRPSSDEDEDEESFEQDPLQDRESAGDPLVRLQQRLSRKKFSQRGRTTELSDVVERHEPAPGQQHGGLGSNIQRHTTIAASQEDHRLDFLEGISSYALQFSWDLVEAVLSKASLALAEDIVPQMDRPDGEVFARCVLRLVRGQCHVALYGYEFMFS